MDKLYIRMVIESHTDDDPLDMPIIGMLAIRTHNDDDADALFDQVKAYVRENLILTIREYRLEKHSQTSPAT